MQRKGRSIVVMAGCLAGAVLLGTIHRPRSVAVCALVDCSGSTQVARAGYFAALDCLVRGLPSGTHFVIGRFDDRVSKVYDGYPTKPKELWEVQRVSLLPDSGRRGTRLDLVLKALVEDQLPVCTEERIAVTLCFDGENTGSDLTPAIAKLASDRRVRAVWLYGVKPEFRLSLERQFRPLGGRLITLDKTDQAARRMAQLLTEEGTHDQR